MNDLRFECLRKCEQCQAPKNEQVISETKNQMEHIFINTLARVRSGVNQSDVLIPINTFENETLICCTIFWHIILVKSYF